MHPNPSKNINLPKLDKIIVRNNPANYRSPPIYDKNFDKKQIDIDVSSLLKIEGKSNQKHEIRYD